MSSLNSSSLVSLLRDSLESSFPLYEQSHFVHAHGDGWNWDVQYSNLPFLTSNKFRGVELHFGLRGEGHGFLGWVFVPKKLRRNGFGSSLLNVGESVLKVVGCVDVELTPSGNGKLEFYGKRGYSVTDSPFDVMIKKL